MSTIKDVAERAGVSITSVSHVLNNTRRVNPGTVERVLTAVKDLGYKPNAVARSLRSKTTHTFGMVLPDNSNPFFAEIARSVEDACFEMGYNIILCNSDSDPRKEQTYIRVLAEKQVDGIVFVALDSYPHYLEEIVQKDLPGVIVDREFSGLGWDLVLCDNRLGGQQATEHLVDLGHRRIACISGPFNVTPSAERIHGYRDTLTAAGLSIEADLMRLGDFRAPSGYDAMRELLELPDLPTAVFACNDLMAIGAMRAITERGLRVPEDIALVGFDDISLSSYTNPTLTTIAQPTQKMGRLAAELLVSRISSEQRPAERHTLPTRLVIRESTGG